MIMTKRPFTVKLLFALPLVATLVWSLLAAAQTNPFFGPLRASQLTGMKVEDSDGGKVGTVRNLVLDLRDGKLKYVVIGSGGILGVRATLKVAPSQAISAATAKRETLAVNVSTPQWNHAPVFKSSHLSELSDPNHAEEISLYFNSARNHASNAKSPSLSITGRNSPQPANGPSVDLKFASDLIGRHVMNDKQEKIGEISDLLVRFGPARQAFVIISSGRVFHHGNQFVVPLGALNASANDRKLTLHIDNPMLQQAPPFNREVWESDGTNGTGRIYLYSKAED
jgi:sporulation protein YlmC with PRC-barrel domain